MYRLPVRSGDHLARIRVWSTLWPRRVTTEVSPKHMDVIFKSKSRIWNRCLANLSIKLCYLETKKYIYWYFVKNSRAYPRSVCTFPAVRASTDSPISDPSRSRLYPWSYFYWRTSSGPTLWSFDPCCCSGDIWNISVLSKALDFSLFHRSFMTLIRVVFDQTNDTS